MTSAECCNLWSLTCLSYVAVFLTAFAGIMSGLTLGLVSWRRT